MKMIDIIEKVSELYRAECGKQYDLGRELLSVNMSLAEAEEHHYENMTAAEHMRLTMRRSILEGQIEQKKMYCLGISDTRELLIDMVSDFDVEVT